jgi:hypothetical protein
VGELVIFSPDLVGRVRARCIFLKPLLPLCQQHLQEFSGGQAMSSSGTGTPGPPPYEVIAQSQGPSELPPPTYAEAVALLQQSGIQGIFCAPITLVLLLLSLAMRVRLPSPGAASSYSSSSSYSFSPRVRDARLASREM